MYKRLAAVSFSWTTLTFVAFSMIFTVKISNNSVQVDILLTIHSIKPVMKTGSCVSKIFLAIVFILSSLATQAQGLSLFDHLYGQPLAKVELKTDLQSFLQNRTNSDYIPAFFIFSDQQGQQQELAIKIKVRGKYRRMKCDLPPIKLNFDKEELVDLGFSAIDKYKLVTHCLDSKEGEDLVLREHLVYQLHNIITPNSFRTQLIEITYFDTGTGDRSTHYGIIIENEEEMAQRLGGAVCEDCYGVNRKFSLDNVLKTSVFQYMIGNTDWSIAKQKNVKVLTADQSDVFQIISYDFDFSGLVDAPYYVPATEFGLSYRERYYKGIACTEEQMLQCLDYFKSFETVLLGTVDDHPFLTRRSKIDIKRYLGSFFYQIDTRSGHKRIKGIAYIP